MKKKTTAFVICIFLLVALFIVYIFSELYTESDMTSNIENSITDAIKFKEEYEGINGKETESGKTVRNLNIDNNNPFEYITDEKLLELINNKETFVVYFGFSSCPWCRSVIEEFINSAKDHSIENVYYLDIKEIRDKYELNESHEAVRTKEGTNAYYELLNKLSNVLDDYEPLTYVNAKGKTKKVTINEKRIYAPNFILVKDGVAEMKVTGIPESISDPYMDLTEEIKKYEKDTFDKLFSLLSRSEVTTTCDNFKC